ncbi:sulfate transporter CysZ [Cellvibrio japonicus]|uniref:Putative sulfate transporter n=1 Tax=Cellvibrio japonicus (strain Ueda107) TaxID=498211 RepID=B3PLE9_CELJU|nr:sulfate transporter CysZ [Cellvibrio japonicus]ACE83255.1 putative sulfate transporter [Cellvibrio japonicus Ueda107]QEI11599.1 sulfate transporter CysZ [Cellvibrio japonicus]QEI15173.1 sulfate transporter CysZ [Cellvibrio japonicus]QEI18753.1 sulfate transporter CysZ [Cellvibrio japonicus]
MQGSPGNAIDYFLEGARLISKPGFRRFILIPLLANLVIFVVLTIALFNAFQDFFVQILEWTPGWLHWFTWILWPLVAFLFLVIYGYSFNVITNFIAAPFFGILAGRLEKHLTGVEPPDEPWGELIPRTLKRELTKLWYFISRGLLVLLVFIVLFFIPGLNLLGVFIATLWSCWCMAVQYVDYPADNHKTGFRPLRRKLNRLPLTSYSYGGLILLGSMIPLINIVVTPIAVAGATRYWVDELRHLDTSH